MAKGLDFLESMMAVLQGIPTRTNILAEHQLYISQNFVINFIALNQIRLTEAEVDSAQWSLWKSGYIVAYKLSNICE